MHYSSPSPLTSAVLACEVQFKAQRQLNPTNEEVQKEFVAQCRDYNAEVTPHALNAISLAAETLRRNLQRL